MDPSSISLSQYPLYGHLYPLSSHPQTNIDYTNGRRQLQTGQFYIPPSDQFLQHMCHVHVDSSERPLKWMATHWYSPRYPPTEESCLSPQDPPSYYRLLESVFPQPSVHEVDHSTLPDTLSSLPYCINSCVFSVMLHFCFLTLNSKYASFPNLLPNRTENILIQSKTCLRDSPMLWNLEVLIYALLPLEF